MSECIGVRRGGGRGRFFFLIFFITWNYLTNLDLTSNQLR